MRQPTKRAQTLAIRCTLGHIWCGWQGVTSGMSHDSWKPLSAPPPPSLIVGRGKELAELRELLTKQLRTKETGVVCFSSHSLKGARAELGLTQQVLAKRSGYGLRAIKKAEAG